MPKAAISERIDEFETACRAQGLPITAQRRVVFEELVKTDVHPTADQVYDLVRSEIPAISRTTVYRVLEVLARVGLVQRIPHPWSASRFDGNTKRHHHLVCRECGEVYDIHDERFNDLPTPTGKPAGFRVEDYSVVFSGACAECRAGA